VSLSELLRISRQKTFMTQEAFAKTIHVSVATINRWENGKSKPNLSAMKRIKEFCEQNGLQYSDIEDAWLAPETKSIKERIVQSGLD